MEVIIGVSLIGGLLAGMIAGGKGLSFGGYFLGGALLPIIGVIVALAATPAVSANLRQLTPPPGEGWWPDPTGRFDDRYFDGTYWTKNVGRRSDMRKFEDPLH